MRASCAGIAMVTFLGLACGQSAPSRSSSTPPSASREDGHRHVAPHGGSLVELGDEFAHVELLLDSRTGALTAYALDGEAARAVQIPQAAIQISLRTPGGAPAEITLAGVGNVLTGETESHTSEFRAVVPALRGVGAFEGTITAVLVRGRQFAHVRFRYPSADE